MKFKLTTSGDWYTKKQANRLMTLGFTFEKDDFDKERPWLKSRDSESEVEITSLEELIAFRDKWGPVIIFENTIEIYDSSRD